MQIKTLLKEPFEIPLFTYKSIAYNEFIVIVVTTVL